MQISIVELQVLVSTLIFLPVAIVLTVIFFRGGFKNIENIKYIVTEHNEKDYWSSDDGDGRVDT